MKKFIAMLMICGLILPANVLFAANASLPTGGTMEVPCKITFPMGKGGGRTNDPNLNPVVQKVAVNAALNKQAEDIANTYGTAMQGAFETLSNDMESCVIDIGLDFMGKIDLADLINQVLNAAISALLSAACNFIKESILDMTRTVTNTMTSQLQTTVPLFGTIGAGNVVSIGGSRDNITWTIKDGSKVAEDLASSVPSTAASNAQRILNSIKPDTFQRRLEGK